MVDVSIPSSRFSPAAKPSSQVAFAAGLYLTFISGFSTRSRHQPGACFLEDSLGRAVGSLLLLELPPQLRVAAEKPTRSHARPLGDQVGGLFLEPAQAALLPLPARGKVLLVARDRFVQVRQ